MNMTANDNYRRAFWIALAFAIALAITSGTLWWRVNHSNAPMQAQPASQESVTAPTTTSVSQPSIQEAPLAPIQLSSQQMQSIGVVLGKVQIKSVTSDLRFYGTVQIDERKQVYVQTRFAGWIRKVYADATGNFVSKGRPLFTIYSPDLVATEQEYLLAKKNSKTLQQSTVRGVASGASSLLDAAKERLLQWDISPTEIEQLDKDGKPITDLTIYSPTSGYITNKQALPNMYVQPETMLYTIADLSDVWVLAQVFQNDAGKIKPGDRAAITVDAYPDKTFYGHVDYLLPQLDQSTRTLPVRFVFENSSLKLKPGMYVNVTLKLPMGRQLVVPASAVFQSGMKSLVFVHHDEGTIEPREVEVGSQVAEDVVVNKGLRQDEEIVTSANFLIDSEAQLQAATGSFVPLPPGAGQAASMNATPQMGTKAELTTNPDPPHKGSNVIRVKLTGQDDKPIAGVNVSVTFFMAAMPAMGMAAMKTVINTKENENGIYEGTGDLGSGGTWQVTIHAEVNGQTIINKQMTVNATGGM